MTFYPCPSWEGQGWATPLPSTRHLPPVGPVKIQKAPPSLPSEAQKHKALVQMNGLNGCSGPDSKLLIVSPWSPRACATWLCLRGHLAGLCSHPSNAATSISTCLEERAIIDFRPEVQEERKGLKQLNVILLCTRRFKAAHNTDTFFCE